jgi:hypothetical protein
MLVINGRESCVTWANIAIKRSDQG